MEKREKEKCLRLSLQDCTPLFLLYPSLVEVDRVIGCKPSSVEVLWLYWLRAYPSVVRRCLREELGTPSVVTNPSW